MSGTPLIVEYDRQFVECASPGALREVLDGSSDRAFCLSFRGSSPVFMLHFGTHRAYVHFFPTEEHPGFQPAQPDIPDDSMIQLPDVGGGTIAVLRDQMVTRQVAIEAALEFQALAELPRSILWTEL